MCSLSAGQKQSFSDLLFPELELHVLVRGVTLTIEMLAEARSSKCPENAEQLVISTFQVGLGKVDVHFPN